MSWTDITRREHKRNLERYPSDLTAAEWRVVEPIVHSSIGALVALTVTQGAIAAAQTIRVFALIKKSPK